jgi:hypothetical protein
VLSISIGGSFKPEWLTRGGLYVAMAEALDEVRDEVRALDEIISRLEADQDLSAAGRGKRVRETATALLKKLDEHPAVKRARYARLNARSTLVHKIGEKMAGDGKFDADPPAGEPAVEPHRVSSCSRR